ncbi:MAG TPA: NAD(P)H-dependent oxidoreductase [Stellaceae bacterium]|nr:NAD(P)H-dependent oxidoreductase [Stellaceae bacterium]
MRVLVIFAHPVETSYHAAIKAQVVEALAARHEVDLLDLYAEAFEPAVSRAERLGYHSIPSNQAPVAGYIDRLTRAEAMVLCFPTWIFGPPAMLKGFFDRVFLPGVAFELLPNGKARGALRNIRKIAGIVTYGQTRWVNFLMGDYPRRFVTRYLPRTAGGGARASFIAHYDMNRSTPATRARFLDRVTKAMARF